MNGTPTATTPGPAKLPPSPPPTLKRKRKHQAQSQQRRPQLAQGLGRMNGIRLRPPGKMGLAFDVILSGLQGVFGRFEEDNGRGGGRSCGGGIWIWICNEMRCTLVPANLPLFLMYLPHVCAPPLDIAQPPLLPPSSPPSNNQPAAAPAAAGGLGAGSPTAFVAVPATILTEAGRRRRKRRG
ncbi:hypothetical protein CVT25_003465 [Psilocybe cyanescens]|uniref:Uncharacterized protein n=1 Tax=Psilocybe cyanescens TaxID=93625 RepID=A0A409WLY6_PSICY|nr:hypothetical protein CVT25_003465 [Psilocybe cyanescens]